MSPLLSSLSTAMILALLGALSTHLRQQAQQRQNQAWKQGLQTSLELLQRLQKHRGLGAQTEPQALVQRQQLVRELEQFWRQCPQDDSGLAELDGQWRQLRQQPDDFDGHCRLIEHLLNAAEHLELRLARQLPAVSGLVQACRELEDLARLRGLAVRGARHARCPLQLQVQMRYLCQRLAPPGGSSPLRGLLQRLQRELIDAPQVQLQPADCFALLTPLIDERLGHLQRQLA